MSDFADASGNKIGYFPLDMVSGETSDPIVVTVVAKNGRRLVSSGSSLVNISAREHGTDDPLVNLTDGIDLSGYTPDQEVQFDVVVTALTVSGRGRDTCSIGVVDESVGAGWNA